MDRRELQEVMKDRRALERVIDMCQHSLCPDTYAAFEAVVEELCFTRKIVIQREY